MVSQAIQQQLINRYGQASYNWAINKIQAILGGEKPNFYGIDLNSPSYQAYQSLISSVPEIQQAYTNQATMQIEARSRGFSNALEMQRAGGQTLGTTSTVITATLPQQQAEQLFKLGITPVIVGGKLTGFQDKTLQQSYSLQNIPQQRLQQLQQAGIIQPTTQTIQNIPQPASQSIQQQQLYQKTYQLPQQAGFQKDRGTIQGMGTYNYPANKQSQQYPGVIFQTLPEKVMNTLKGKYFSYTGSSNVPMILTSETAGESTTLHELGHYKISAIKPTDKLTAEGKKILQNKYGDTSIYYPSEYAKEGLAEAYSLIQQGKDIYWLKQNAPETYKIVSNLSAPGTGKVALTGQEYQPSVSHTSDLGVALTQAREQFKEAGKVYVTDELGNKIEVNKVWIPSKEGAFGLGGHFVYKDAQGNLVGTDVNILQTTTKEQIAKFGILQKSERYLQEARYKHGEAGGFEAVAIGAGLSALGTAKFLKAFITEPITTVKAIPSGIKQMYTFTTSGELANVIRQEPGIALGYGITEYFSMKGGGKLFDVGTDVTKAIYTRISPSYRAVEVSGLGEKTIKGVPSLAEETKTFDIGLIPERGARLDINPIKFVEEADIPMKISPTIPKVSSEFREVLAVTKQTGDIVTGSFAQKVLLKEEFTRPYKDLDIVSKTPKETARLITERQSNLQMRKMLITDSPMGKFDIFKIEKRGKQIADIDPFKYAEEGYIKKYGTINVEGIEFASPKARLAAKVEQFARGKAKSKPKIIEDIKLLTGGKVKLTELDKATLTGPYGYTAKELASYIGKTGPVTTSARDLFGLFKKEVKIKETGGYGLFATPFDLKTKQAMTRVTRLGIEEQDASIMNLISGDVSFRRAKSQIVVFEKQTIGADFKVPFKSSELEVEAKGLIREKGRAGVTLITPRGKIIPRRVPILIGEFADVEKALSKKTLDLVKKQSLTDSELLSLQKRLSKETGISYREPQPYISPVRLTSHLKSAVYSEPISTKATKSSYLLISKQSQISAIPSVSKVPSYGVSKISKAIYSEPSVTKQVYREPTYGRTTIYREPYRQPRYRTLYVPTKRVPPYYPKLRVPPLTQKFKLPTDEPTKKQKRKSALGFDVYKILKGKPVRIARGLSETSAKDIGAREILKNLRATFFLKKSDMPMRDIPTGGEFMRFEKLFRRPVQKSRLRKFSDDVYVQKASRTGMFGGRLAFKGEKKEIQSARLNKLIRSIA